MTESISTLKQLVENEKATIIYVHGTARSGSTIAEIIFSQLCDRAVHQPWRGILQHRGGRFRPDKLEFDADIYQAGCELIVQHILEILNKQPHATILVKELAGFFKPPIWQSWIEIPSKFIFTIRDPHLQYVSWLSAMTDKIFQGQGKLQENREFVLEKTPIVENTFLPAEWEGTTISCNHNAWQALLNDYLCLRKHITKTGKQLAIIEGILLRKEPDEVIARTLKQVDFKTQANSRLSKNLYQHSQQRVVDIRDANRPMVKKARSSNSVTPLAKEENFDFNLLPLKSQQHLQQIIPIYLNLLYAAENISMPSLKQLEQPVRGGDGLKLQEVNPFLAYAIAKFHQSELVPKFQANSHSFKPAWRIVDRYWQLSNQGNHTSINYQTT